MCTQTVILPEVQTCISSYLLPTREKHFARKIAKRDPNSFAMRAHWVPCFVFVSREMERQMNKNYSSCTVFETENNGSFESSSLNAKSRIEPFTVISPTR